MQQEIVRVCLITGYLGAGKTTLLNRILANSEGIRAAVIVNDIGEVNIDAELIAKKGTVSVEEKSLIPLTNGCICCTLSDDLAKQLSQLADSGLYNYIIIEASGICEPIPIAQTISMICKENSEDGLYMKMDNVIAVVDCARMLQEFENGRKLMREAIEEDDIENLLIQQIEFCNTILLNKTDLVTEDELDELKAIIRTLQKEAVMIETQQAGAKIEDLIHTDRFDLNRSMAAAGWVDAIQSFNAADAGRGGHDHEDQDHEAHDHEDHAHEDHDHEAHDHEDHDHEDHAHEDHDHEAHAQEDHGHESHAHGGHHHHHDHHHHHHDGESHILEYGISTFVYFRRRPFNRDKLVELCDYWPHSIIRCKGMIWYEHEPNVSFMFEQAGRQITESPSGVFLAAAPEKVQQRMLRQYPQIRDMWDETYGDRMIKLVFIGKDMDEEALTLRLDACLGK